MALIDKSYFVGDLNIPGTTGGSPAEERLNWFMAKYERELLELLLGYELYKAFIAGIAVANPATPDQRYLDLRDGKEYTDLVGRTRKWKGLAFTEGSTTKRSLIANYVYFYWMQDATTQTVSIGEVQTKGENSTVVGPGLKMVRAWNELSTWKDELVCFLDRSVADYPEWQKQNVFQLNNHLRPLNRFGI